MRAEPDLFALQKRLQDLEDERDIVRTLYTYGQAYDYSEHERWVDCFTDDASYLVLGPDGSEYVRCQGREELRVWITTVQHAFSRWTQHLLLDPLVEVDGDSATSVAYFVRTDDHPETAMAYVSATGRYRDVLTRGADGRWRFRSRLAEMETILRGTPPSL